MNYPGSFYTSSDCEIYILFENFCQYIYNEKGNSIKIKLSHENPSVFAEIFWLVLGKSKQNTSISVRSLQKQTNQFVKRASLTEWVV